MINSKSIALMFTDIVGYSQMVAKNEKLALKILDEHNNIIFPIIKKHKGYIIKLIGDAIFAKFHSPNDSVLSSIEIQKKLNARNQIHAKNEVLIIRIGLHYGQVIEKDDDLFGHDVNLCSRIESVTEPGSINISEEVYRNTKMVVLPDRSKVNMFVPFMSNYNKLLVDTCHKRGAFGMGGMSAQVIAKANPKEINEKALDGVKKDKERELRQKERQMRIE